MIYILRKLPLPPTGKTGWPWTEESKPIPEKMFDGKPWPKISIVTPSYNQGQFLEETIRSVLLQNYPNLEYIIIDGGSTDDSVEIIKKYEPWLTYWVSEKDGGQANAINKGFRMATGDFVAWQNSDDYYYPDSFGAIGLAAHDNPDAEVFHGTSHYIDKAGNILKTLVTKKFILEEQTEVFPELPFSNHSIFFQKVILENKGFLNEQYVAFDMEFLIGLALSKHKFIYVPALKGVWRIYDDIISVRENSKIQEELLDIYIRILDSHKVSKSIREGTLNKFHQYLICLFREGNMSLFRHGIYKLLALEGICSLDAKMVARYIFSFFGRQIHSVLLFKSRFKSG